VAPLSHSRGLCVALAGLLISWAGSPGGARAADAAGGTAGLARQFLERGARALAEGADETALDAFAQAAQVAPDCMTARLGSGVAQLRLGRRAEADRSFRLAAGSLPAAATVGQALTALASGEVLAARSLLKQSVELNVQPDAGVRAALAYSALLAGDCADARTEAQLVLESDPANYLALMVMAEAGTRLGAAAEAGNTLRQILDFRARSLITPARQLALLGPEALVSGRSPLEGMGAISAAARFERPGIRIVTPLTGTTVRGKVPFLASIIGEVRPLYVTFYVNGDRVHATDKPPYRFTWDVYDLVPGEYLISARAQEGYLGAELYHDQVVVHVTRESGLPVALAADEEPTTVRQMVAAMAPQPSEAWVASLRERLTQLTQRDPAEREPTLPPGWSPVTQAGADAGTSPQVPRPAGVQPPVTEGPVVRPVAPIAPRHLRSVALIFDDGPHPLVTPALLRILAEQDVKASFFLVGTQAEQYPELVRRIAQEGHDIGNHTYEHLNLDGLLAPEVQRQMLGGKALLEAILGRPVTYFRAPGENFGPRAQLVASQASLTVIPSSLNTWPLMALAPEEIARRMATQAQDGSTILLHNGQDKTVYCLEPLIRMLREAGFEFLTVGQWLQRYPGRAFEAPATQAASLAGEATPSTGIAAASGGSAVGEPAVPLAGAH